jgi:uncharacterized protein (DUF433 family)
MRDRSECPSVERVPGKVGGAWSFKGTRVPVKALFENLESGARVDDFLEWFPGVTREQVEAVLDYVERSPSLPMIVRQSGRNSRERPTNHPLPVADLGPRESRWEVSNGEKGKTGSARR